MQCTREVHSNLIPLSLVLPVPVKCQQMPALPLTFSPPPPPPLPHAAGMQSLWDILSVMRRVLEERGGKGRSKGRKTHVGKDEDKMKRELAEVKREGAGVEERKREGKHFFFIVFVVMRHCKKGDRMTDSEGVREQKRTAAVRETGITKAERERRKDSSRKKDLQERDSCCSTPQNNNKKQKNTGTEKQVDCTAPAQLLFIQIKPGGLFECLCLCVFWCVHASACVFARGSTSLLFACVCMCVCAANVKITVTCM